MNNYPLSIKIKKGLMYLASRYQTSPPEESGKENIAYCYHSIENDNWFYTTTPAEFMDQLILLMRHKKIVDLKTFLSKTSIGETNLATITFDDGYEDVITHALPILEQNGIKATVFITGIREVDSTSELHPDKKLLSYEQIKHLHGRGWTIGYHTWSHPSLRNLTEDELYFQISTSKRVIEEKLGFDLEYFAYPGGIYNYSIMNIVYKAGFKAAFTVDGGDVKNVINPYLINRVMIDNSFNSAHDFSLLLNSSSLRVNQTVTKAFHTFDQIKKSINLF